jgi:2-C-methyl-D-erythritol 4-phosphate cytidylyltransferase
MLILGIAFLFVVKHYIIIVAGGTGTRMQSDLPKQFMAIKHKPVIIHTILQFIKTLPDSSIIVSIHREWKKHLIQILAEFKLNDKVKIVFGGETRFHSVKNGLNLVPNEDSVLVGIHDAARPMVSSNTIVEAMQMAIDKGNGIPVMEVNESLRILENGQNKYIDRSIIRSVQTPQCFQAKLIKSAFEQAYDPQFTDDASVVEKIGSTIYLTKGNPENIKITWPSDILFANAFITE